MWRSGVLRCSVCVCFICVIIYLSLLFSASSHSFCITLSFSLKIHSFEKEIMIVYSIRKEISSHLLNKFSLILRSIYRFVLERGSFHPIAQKSILAFWPQQFRKVGISSTSHETTSLNPRTGVMIREAQGIISGDIKTKRK